MDRAPVSDLGGVMDEVAVEDETGDVGAPGVGSSDPDSVPPPMASGGLGGVNDGTQVTRHPATPVPGKPMAPIADDPAGNSTEEGQAMDTPVSSPHAERGGG